MRAKEHSDDWVWIVDHTIQIGVEKCLLILGVRLSEISDNANKKLQFDDMEPIMLSPIKKSNGDIVYEQLENASKITGVPREIIADNGSDLKKGIETFCTNHSETSYIYDIKHKTAAILKQEFGKDEKWIEFKKRVFSTNQKIRQTEYAFLITKNIRSKARYMNIDILINWGLSTLDYLDSQSPLNKKLEEKLGWLLSCREDLKEWGETIMVVKAIEKYVRERGIYPSVSKDLKGAINKDFIKRDKPETVSKKLFQFIEMESLKAQLKEKLLGSSEIIESAFGKLKNLEGDHSKYGFTSLILSLGAVVSKTTQSIVKKALESVSVKNIRDWCEENLGETLQSKKKRKLNRPHKAEQKPDKIPVVA